MKYWLTVHWPPTERQLPGALPHDIWLTEGRLDVADEMTPGDLVFFYQTAKGPAIEEPDGSKIRRRRGREGIVARARVSEKPAAPIERSPEEYSDGKKRAWCRVARTEPMPPEGFVPRSEAARVLGYKPGYVFRGFGNNSGLKEISEIEYRQLESLFTAQGL